MDLLTFGTGSRQTKALYDRLADSYNPKNYWAIHEWNAQVIAAKGKKARERAGKLRPKINAIKKEYTDPRPIQSRENRQQDNNNNNNLAASFKDEDGDIDVGLEPLPAATSSGQSKLVPKNYYENQPSAKQLSESVADFLTRLPPSKTTATEAQDHWLWICNPFPREDRNSQSKDLPTFMQLGTRLLEGYLDRKTELEQENPDKPAASITRLLLPARKTLETEIRRLALEKGIKNGKWMLFPHEDQVDEIWAIVANAVWEGKLGTAAKVATAKADGDRSGGPNDARDQGQRLICIYTTDFSDTDDILRVLRAIKDLGLINIKGVPVGQRGNAGSLNTIYYKSDAYTHLDISSSNDYKLKASLYGSRELVPQWYPGESSGRGGGRGFRRTY